jgi:hypothetical protein
LDFAHLGSSLSVRGIAKFGSDIQACSKLIFNNANNFIEQSATNELSFKVGNVRSMSMTNTGGTLHGTWSADVTVSMSDRRLKTNIEEIDDTLKKTQKDVPRASSSQKGEPELASESDPAARPSASSWLLRQLRPVSYNFRKGNEAKHMRFGFIADEVEKVLPQVVRELPSSKQDKTADSKEDAKKGIVYQDLIAILTTVVKDFSFQLKGLQGRMKTAESELERLDLEDPMDDEEDEDV